MSLGEGTQAKVIFVADAFLKVNRVGGKGAVAFVVGAEQLALLPPAPPLQVQFQRVELGSVTADALPIAQRFVVGALRD